MQWMRKFELGVQSRSIEDDIKPRQGVTYKLTDLGDKVISAFVKGYQGQLSNEAVKDHRREIYIKLCEHYKEPVDLIKFDKGKVDLTKYDLWIVLNTILGDSYKGILYDTKSPTPEETELKETKRRRGRPKLHFSSHDK